MSPPNRLRSTSAALALSMFVAVTPGVSARAEAYSGRDIIMHVPSNLPPQGQRALVIVLHGGLGNAQRIASGQSESALNMDSVADKSGFVVAYLNGTPVTRRMGANMLGWNAGGCCGQSAENNIDDVAYIKGAIDYLTAKYGIDKKSVFGIGHSNGAMMLQRLVCESKAVSAIVPISGPLTMSTESCPMAQGARILAIHGQDDQNVPLAGGRGSQGLSDFNYPSEEHARQVLTRSGATYDLQIVKGADHKLEHIETAFEKANGQSIPQAAVRFFGITK